MSFRRLTGAVFGLLLCVVAVVPAAASEVDRPDQVPSESLSLLQALPLEVMEGSAVSGLQPSGLAWCNGQLLMVSDRHNRQLFRLLIEDDRVRVEPWLELGDIPQPDLSDYDFGSRWWSRISRRYDWEGLSCDNQGRLYLLSETLAQVLIREADGRLHWSGSASFTDGHRAGLFQHSNAFAEGLAVADGRLVIAAERQPRGLVVMEADSAATTPGWQVAGTYYLSGFPSLIRPVDFSGLWLEGDSLYTLERNHFQLCRRTLKALSNRRPQRCWTYRHVEENPAWAWQDRRFGKAEGLARDAEHLYLVLDNNGGGRHNNADDRRPLLFIFRLPETW